MESVNEFDDSRTVTIGVEADSAVEGWLARETPWLYIRCQSGETEVVVDVGMNSSVEAGRFNQHTVQVRLDDSPAREVVTNESTDGESLFFPNGLSFAQEMLGHERMLFGFVPFNADPQSTTVDIAGIDAAIAPLREACGW